MAETQTYLQEITLQTRVLGDVRPELIILKPNESERDGQRSVSGQKGLSLDIPITNDNKKVELATAPGAHPLGYDQDQKSPGHQPDFADSEQQNQKTQKAHNLDISGGGFGSRKRGPKETQILTQADSLRAKAIKHCLKQEYFDVLTNTHRCSKLILQLTPSDSKSSEAKPSSGGFQDQLKFLRRMHDSAFVILKDCMIYSSIAYIQLQQYDQAVSLTSQLIDIEDLERCAGNDCEYIVQALLIRAQAQEMLGQKQKSLTDLEKGQRLQPDNQIVRNQIDRLKVSIFEEQKKQELGATKQSQRNKSKKPQNHKSAQVASSKLMARREAFESVITLSETFKTPKQNKKLTPERTEDQATALTKSLHPVTPSYIKFDFDEDGQYSSSDSAKQQQEVLNYLMLGAKIGKKESRANQGKPFNSQPSSPSDLRKGNDGLFVNENQFFDSPTKSGHPRKAGMKLATTTQGRQLDMLSQILLLLRQVYRYVSKSKKVQLLLMALFSLYAFVCHRVVRYFLQIRNRESLIGTLAYKPQDLGQALCHYVMLVLDQIVRIKVLQK